MNVMQAFAKHMELGLHKVRVPECNLWRSDPCQLRSPFVRNIAQATRNVTVEVRDDTHVYRDSGDRILWMFVQGLFGMSSNHHGQVARSAAVHDTSLQFVQCTVTGFSR